MLHPPQPFSEHEHHHIQNPQPLHTRRGSTWKKKSFETPPTRSAATPDPKKSLSGDGFPEFGLGFPGLDQGFKARGNPRTVCQICHRQFPSDRALGGHMRVHGPLFNPAAGRKRKLILTDSDSEEEEEEAEEEEEEAVLDVGSNLSIEADSLYMNRSSALYCRDDDEGDGYPAVLTDYHMEARSLDIDDESTAKKNPLYELRHNPKKSQRFADEVLSMEILASGQDNMIKGSTFSASEQTRVCSVCGKAFWSWRALSGHMRCHPEREWRGVLPPVVKAGSRYNQKRCTPVSSFGAHSDVEHESDVEDKEDADPGSDLAFSETRKVLEEEDGIMGKDCVSSQNVTEYDSFWPTGKRSRRKFADSKARSSQASAKADQDEPAAVASEGGTLVDLGEQQHFQVPNLLFMLAEAARMLEGGVEAEHKHGRSDFVLFKGNSIGRQADSQAFLADPRKANTKAGTMRFECSTCKKSFSSPQALGGHRASHKKMKGCFARTGLGEEEIVDELRLGRDHELGTFSLTWQGVLQQKDLVKKEKQQQQLLAPGKGYECSVCHRVFSTGQALGGHKSRCHFTREKATEAAAAAVASVSSSSNKQLSGRGNSSKHDEGSVIDLNLPVSTIEDSEVGCAAVELCLFTTDHVSEIERKVDTLITTESPPQELSLGAPWGSKALIPEYIMGA